MLEDTALVEVKEVVHGQIVSAQELVHGSVSSTRQRSAQLIAWRAKNSSRITQIGVPGKLLTRLAQESGSTGVVPPSHGQIVHEPNALLATDECLDL